MFLCNGPQLQMGLIKILVSETPWHSSLVHARKFFCVYWLIFWFTNNNNTITKFQKQDPWILGFSPIELINSFFCNGAQSYTHMQVAQIPCFVSNPHLALLPVCLSYLICPYVKDGSMKNNETTIFLHLWAAPKELSASSTHMGMLKSTMVKNKEY